MKFIWKELQNDRRNSFIEGNSDTGLPDPVYLNASRTGRENIFRPAGRAESRPVMAPGQMVIDPAHVALSAVLVSDVEFFLSVGNDFSLSLAIKQAFRQYDSMVDRIMRNHRSGGLLAVATLVVSWDAHRAFGAARRDGRPPDGYSGPESGRFGQLNVGTTVYGRARDGYWAWRTSSRLEPQTHEGEYLGYRFFWGHYRGAA